MAVRRHWLAWLGLVTACAEKPAGDADLESNGAPGPTFIDVQIALHASGCSEGGCHSPPNGEAGLELVDAPWENLVGAPVTTCDADRGRRRVVAGDPQASYLLNKLRGHDLCGGNRMPLACEDTASRPCMKPERITLIESWIEAGALRE